jgi:hypothetical protein
LRRAHAGARGRLESDRRLAAVDIALFGFEPPPSMITDWLVSESMKVTMIKLAERSKARLQTLEASWYTAGVDHNLSNLLPRRDELVLAVDLEY